MDSVIGTSPFDPNERYIQELNKQITELKAKIDFYEKFIYKQFGLLDDPMLPQQEASGEFKPIAGYRTLSSIRNELEKKHQALALQKHQDEAKDQ